MTKTFLVTGGAGFVGKALVARLRALGNCVRSFDLAAPAHQDDIQGSILDGGAVRAACRGVDGVFHLAGNAQLWARNPEEFDIVNRQGTETVLSVARNCGIARFVHCSSLTTLVSEATPIGRSEANEEKTFPPDRLLGAYPRSKREAELLVEAADDIDWVIVLPTEPIGPGDETITPPTRMILDFASGKTPAYIDCILNFVPVESLADGLIAAMERGAGGSRYLLAGENIEMKTLLEMIAAETGTPAPSLKMPYWVALMAGAIDTGLVSRLTGKPPKAPLTGVRLAGRQVAFSSGKANETLNWRASPVKPALRALLAWAKTTGKL